MKPIFFLLLLSLSFVGCRTTPLSVVDDSWRSQKPASGNEKQAALPIFHKVMLKNGLTLIVIPEHHLPIVDVKVVVRAGSANDRVNTAGEADICFNMLDEGAGNLDALSLADAFSDLGTQLATAVGQDAGVFNVSILTEHLDRSLELLSLMLQKPRFLQADFNRIKDLHFSKLNERQSIPMAVAMDAFFADAYGENHPYGHPTVGTKKTIERMTLKDIKRFWLTHFSPNSTAIILAGDITLADAKKQVEAHFDRWTHALVAKRKIPLPARKKQASIELISRASSPQTFLLLGRPLLTAKDPNEYALEVFNEILGGMFTSRLNMNLREGKSWTYGVKSDLEPLRGLGPFMIHSSIQVPYVGPALDEIIKEFRRMTETEVTAAELKMAKDGLIKSLPGRFETVQAISSQAAHLFVYDLPLNYFDLWMENIAKVSARQVKEMAAKALDLSQFTMVAVGELDAMKKPVEDLKLGAVNIKQ